jgi:mRNA interferase YafQ
MKTLRFTGQFKKDLKRYLNKPKKLEELKIVMEMLENEIPLPSKYKDHKLHGEYEGCMECHIEGDYLLIRYEETGEIITLYRLGSHSELFRPH